jgi:hypothetical protein
MIKYTKKQVTMMAKTLRMTFFTNPHAGLEPVPLAKVPSLE